MRQSPITATLIPLVLAFLTVLIFVMNIANPLFSTGQYWLEFFVYATLTLFAVILSVPLNGTELSLAHIVGMLAFLTLPPEATPKMTVALGLGALFGSLIITTSREWFMIRRRHPMIWTTTIFITARTTLAFTGASFVYLNQGGIAPLTPGMINSNLFPLTMYAMIYVALYLLIFVLQVFSTTRKVEPVIRENLISIGIIMLLPLPFVFNATDVARRDRSEYSFVISSLGAALIIIGIHLLGRTVQQLRRQLEEIQSITSVTGLLSGKLDIQDALQATYQQLHTRMGVTHLSVALRGELQDDIHYALMIRDGETIQPAHHASQAIDHALIRHVMQTGKPLSLESDARQEALRRGIGDIDERIQSWVGVPLRLDDRIFGAFAVLSTDPDHLLSAEDARSISVIATNISRVIENSRLYEQKSQRTEQLATLNQVSALLTGTLSPGEVLDTVVSSASTLIDANAVAVYLYWDDDLATLALVRSAGLSDRFVSDPPIPALHNTPPNDDSHAPPLVVVVNDSANHPEYGALRIALANEEIRAWIEIPLQISGQVLGVLVLYFRRPQNFASEQIDIMQAFATQAAQAIVNARTFTSTDEALEQRVEQLFVLAAMGRLLNGAIEPGKIYDIVLTYATDATQSPRGAILLKQSDGALHIATQHGFPSTVLDDVHIMQTGPVQRSMDQGAAFRSDDIRQVSGYTHILPRTRSLLLTPIVKGHEVLGVILLESDEVGAYSESDSHFVTQIANQAMIAAENALLFQKISEARDNLQVILNAMEEGIILIDLTGQVALANPAVHLIGMEPEELIGKSVVELIDADDLHFSERLGFSSGEAIRRLLRDLKNQDWRGVVPHTYDLTGEDGLITLQRQLIPIRDEQNTHSGVLMVFYNKTEERELARARDSISQMIVHDLRSPLTAVTTSLRLLSELVPKDSDYRPLVEKTTDASRRAIRKVLTRVDSLLDISKMESGEIYLEREPTTLSHLVNVVKGELDPLAHELDIKIISNVNDDLPFIDVDSDKVERMLLNLIDNALKYSPAHKAVTINATADDKIMTVYVADEGPGVPDEYKKRLFDRFVQVQGRQVVRRGVGLGLTFCRLVAESHGGKIWIEDNTDADSGSKFVFTLPIANMTLDDDDF